MSLNLANRSTVIILPNPLMSLLKLNSIMESFHKLIKEIEKLNLLEIEDSDYATSKQYYLAKGTLKFKKPFMKTIFTQFDYWYAIFEINSVSGKLKIGKKWYDGDEIGAVEIQNYVSKPSWKAKEYVEEKHLKIKELARQINSN